MVDKAEVYLKDRNNVLSMFNVDILTRLTDNDLEDFLITDEYKFRVDKIAGDYLGNTKLGFLILLINRITKFSQLDSDNTIQLPTTEALFRIHDRIKIERGLT